MQKKKIKEEKYIKKSQKIQNKKKKSKQSFKKRPKNLCFNRFFITTELHIYYDLRITMRGSIQFYIFGLYQNRSAHFISR